MPKSKLQQHEGSSVEKNDFPGNDGQNSTTTNASLVFQIFRYLTFAGFILTIVAAIFGLPLLIPVANAGTFRNNRNSHQSNQLITNNISLPLASLQQTEFLGAIQAEKELHSTTKYTVSNSKQKLDQVIKIQNIENYITFEYDNLLEKYLNSFSFEDSEKYLGLIVYKAEKLFNNKIKTENVLSFIILANDLFDLTMVSAAHKAYELIEPKTAHGCYAKSIFYFKKAELAESDIEGKNIDFQSIHNSIVYLKKSISMENNIDNHFLLINTHFNDILKKAITTKACKIRLVIKTQLKLTEKIEKFIGYMDKTNIDNLSVTSGLLRLALEGLKFSALYVDKQIIKHYEIVNLKNKIENSLNDTYEQMVNLLDTKNNDAQAQEITQQSPNGKKINYLLISIALFITTSIGIFLTRKAQEKQNTVTKNNEAKNTQPLKKHRKKPAQLLAQIVEKIAESNPMTLEEKIQRLKSRILNFDKNKLKELLDIKNQIASYTTDNNKKLQTEKTQSVIDIFEKNYGSHITSTINKIKKIEAQINQLSTDTTTEADIQQFDNIITELNQAIDDLAASVTKDNSLKTLEKELEKHKATDENSRARQKPATTDTTNSSSSSSVPVSVENANNYALTTQLATQEISVQTNNSLKPKIKKEKEKEKVDTKSDSTYKSLKKLKTFDDLAQEKKQNDKLLELIKLQLDLMQNTINAFNSFKSEQTRFDSLYYNKEVPELVYKSMIIASLAYGMMKSAYATVGWLQKSSHIIVGKKNYLEYLHKLRNYLMHEFDFNETTYELIDTLSQEYFNKTNMFIHEINQKTKKPIDNPPIIDLGFIEQTKARPADYLEEIKTLIEMHNDFYKITKPIKDKGTYDYASLVHNAERYLIALIGERFSKMAKSNFTIYKKLTRNIKKHYPELLVAHHEKLITKYEKFRIDVGHLVDGLTQTQEEFDLIFKAGVFHPLNDMLPEHLNDMSKLSIQMHKYFQSNADQSLSSARHLGTSSSLFSSQSTSTVNTSKPSSIQSHTL